METKEKSLSEMLGGEKQLGKFVDSDKEKYEDALALLIDGYTKKEGRFNFDDSGNLGYTILIKNKSSNLKIEYQRNGDKDHNFPQINIYTGKHILKKVGYLYKTKCNGTDYYKSDMSSSRDQKSPYLWEKILLGEASKIRENKQTEQQNDGDVIQNSDIRSIGNPRNSLEKLLFRDFNVHTKNLYKSAMSLLDDSRAKKEGYTNSNGDYSIKKKDKFSQIKIAYEHVTYQDKNDHNETKSYNRLCVYTGRNFQKCVLSVPEGNLNSKYIPGSWENLLVNDGVYTQSQRKLSTIRYPNINRLKDFVNYNSDELLGTSLALGAVAGGLAAYEYSPILAGIGLFSAVLALPIVFFITSAMED